MQHSTPLAETLDANDGQGGTVDETWGLTATTRATIKAACRLV